MTRVNSSSNVFFQTNQNPSYLELFLSCHRYECECPENRHIIKCIIIKYLLNIKPDQNIFCSSWQAVRRYAMEGGRGEEGGERSDKGGDEGEEEDAADR